jgi:hypothetical protein
VGCVHLLLYLICARCQLSPQSSEAAWYSYCPERLQREKARAAQRRRKVLVLLVACTGVCCFDRAISTSGARHIGDRVVYAVASGACMLTSVCCNIFSRTLDHLQSFKPAHSVSTIVASLQMLYEDVERQAQDHLDTRRASARKASNTGTAPLQATPLRQTPANVASRKHPAPSAPIASAKRPTIVSSLSTEYVASRSDLDCFQTGVAGGTGGPDGSPRSGGMKGMSGPPCSPKRSTESAQESTRHTSAAPAAQVSKHAVPIEGRTGSNGAGYHEQQDSTFYVSTTAVLPRDSDQPVLDTSKRLGESQDASAGSCTSVEHLGGALQGTPSDSSRRLDSVSVEPAVHRDKLPPSVISSSEKG